MTIAVTTPTGNVGSELGRALIRAGQRPRLLCRDPSRLDAEVRDGCDPVVCDQRDPDAVRAALAGVEAVYWVHPDDWTRPDPNADVAGAAQGLADAVRADGVARVVLQSTIGAELRHGAGFLDGLGAAEQVLDGLVEHGVHVLHLRCAYFMSNLLMDVDSIRAGRLTTNRDPDEAMPWVGPVDIASVACGRLLNDAWTGRVVQAVHGPADLTWPQAARIVADAVGHEIRVVHLSDDTVRERLRASGLSETAVAGVMGMSTGTRDGFVPEQPRTVGSTTPTTLAAWCADHRGELSAQAS